MTKSVDEIWEDIQFDKQIVKLIEENNTSELMKLLLVNGGLERLLRLVSEDFIPKYRIWEILNVIPKPPIEKWEDKWEDSEDSEDFTVFEWERVCKDFGKSHSITGMKLFMYNGKAYLRVYYRVKVRKRTLANKDEIEKWSNSLTEEQKRFIQRVYEEIVKESFDKKVSIWGEALALEMCYWEVFNKLEPKRYSAEPYEDDHDREPYPHWVR